MAMLTKNIRRINKKPRWHDTQVSTNMGAIPYYASIQDGYKKSGYAGMSSTRFYFLACW
jgi:hypothetical protein